MSEPEKCPKCHTVHDVPRLVAQIEDESMYLSAEVDGPYQFTGFLRNIHQLRSFVARLGILLEDHACQARQLAAAQEKINELLSAAECDDACCLAEGHNHKNRVEDAVCSFRFQLAAAKHENKRLLAELSSLRIRFVPESAERDAAEQACLDSLYPKGRKP